MFYSLLLLKRYSKNIISPFSISCDKGMKKNITPNIKIAIGIHPVVYFTITGNRQIPMIINMIEGIIIYFVIKVGDNPF